jgi:hypothetical protein
MNAHIIEARARANAAPRDEAGKSAFRRHFF